MLKTCSICAAKFYEQGTVSVFVEAGEWLAEEIWQDAGTLCQQCLENRARLAMMYLHEHNT